MNLASRLEGVPAGPHHHQRNHPLPSAAPGPRWPPPALELPAVTSKHPHRRPHFRSALADPPPAEPAHLTLPPIASSRSAPFTALQLRKQIGHQTAHTCSHLESVPQGGPRPRRCPAPGCLPADFPVSRGQKMPPSPRENRDLSRQFRPADQRHLDVIQRAAKLFERVCGIAKNENKNPLFSMPNAGKW